MCEGDCGGGADQKDRGNCIGVSAPNDGCVTTPNGAAAKGGAEPEKEGAASGIAGAASGVESIVAAVCPCPLCSASVSFAFPFALPFAFAFALIFALLFALPFDLLLALLLPFDFAFALPVVGPVCASLLPCSRFRRLVLLRVCLPSSPPAPTDCSLFRLRVRLFRFVGPWVCGG